MNHAFQPVLFAAASIALVACSPPSPEEIRQSYIDLSSEKLLAVADAESSKCRQDAMQVDKTAGACERSSIAHEVAEGKGWCWGPRAAISANQAWMSCADDVTRPGMASEHWFAVTEDGLCRESSMQEAIGKVLAHDGQWNIKTRFTKQGFFVASSKIDDKISRSTTIYPSCSSALMTYIAAPGSEDRAYIAVPLGLSPRSAGEIYGFSFQSCNTYPFGTGFGCNFGYSTDISAPIQFIDGFVPCRPNGPVQLDFQPKQGLVGVTCSATADTKAVFDEQMAANWGPGVQGDDGARRWRVGAYSAVSVESAVLGRTLYRVSVYLN